MNGLVSLWVDLGYIESVSTLVVLHNSRAAPTDCLSYSVDPDTRYSVRVVTE